MDDNELESLFEDAVSTEEKPAADDGQQEDKKQQQESTDTSGKKEAPRPPQTAQENARQAAGRRSREREQIAQQARAAARAEVSATLASLGIEDPDSGTVIGTVDELEAYAKNLSDQRISSGRANAEDIRRIAREAVQTSSSPEAEINRQLEQLQEMEPAWADIPTKDVLGAVLQSELGADFRQAVNEGATFLQAYSRALKAQGARAKGSASTAAAKASSKGHLNATSQRGTGALDVPADELKLFRELNPDASDADIQKFYNQDKKKFG